MCQFATKSESLRYSQHTGKIDRAFAMKEVTADEEQGSQIDVCLVDVGACETHCVTDHNMDTLTMDTVRSETSANSEIQILIFLVLGIPLGSTIEAVSWRFSEKRV